MSVENPTAKLKPVLDGVFRFQVGDAVVPRSTVEEVLSSVRMSNGHKHKIGRFGGSPAGARTMIIHGRRVEECHGGVQLMYLVRTWDEKSAQMMLFEYELSSVAEFEEAQSQRVEIEL